MEIRLCDLIELLKPERTTITKLSLVVNGVSCSSSEDLTGKVFVAIKGERADGHSYLEQAKANGALAVIVQDAAALTAAPGLLVRDTRRALSQLVALFSGRPSSKMTIFGVTGTNGKTTTNWMIHSLLLSLGMPSMRMGTLGLEIVPPDGAAIIRREGGLTTPDPLQIHGDLKSARELGVHSCVMEVSSHSLVQCRTDDVEFDVGVFTNLSRDHLDYHSSMEDYFAAKRKLFRLLADSPKEIKLAIINIDCEFGEQLRKALSGFPGAIITFGREKGAVLHLDKIEQDVQGSSLNLTFAGEHYQVWSPFIGIHNSENLLAALGACTVVGEDMERLLSLVPMLPQVPGRLESVGTKDVGVYVDYAHTPDALANAIRTLRPITRSKLYVLFGCGGDRDKGKRPEMAKVAGELADRVIVTSDNPRTEDPKQIIKEILGGGLKPTLVEPDRRAAIEKALSGAKSGDVVLIAGKGHEDYQIIGTTKHHFSDVEEVRRIIG